MKNLQAGVNAGCCFAVVLLGLLMLLSGVKLSWEYFQSRQWQTTTGQITESVLDSEVRTIPAKPRPYTGSIYWARIRYTYRVDAHTYNNDQIRLTDHVVCFLWICRDQTPESTLVEDIQPIVDQYPVNQAVTVYYDPAHPEQAVLERNHSPLVWVFIGLGASVMLAAVFLYLAILSPPAYERPS